MTVETSMTLDECAHCVDQLNIDLQRQTAAFRYFKAAAASVAATKPTKAPQEPQRLPFIKFTYPQGDKPIDYKLDLNTMSNDAVIAMAPVFDTLVDEVGDNLLTAWDRLIKVLEIAAPQVQRAQQAALNGN